LIGDGHMWWSDKTYSCIGSNVIKISCATHDIILHCRTRYKVIRVSNLQRLIKNYQTLWSVICSESSQVGLVEGTAIAFRFILVYDCCS
jgi:hypothetical protein